MIFKYFKAFKTKLVQNKSKCLKLELLNWFIFQLDMEAETAGEELEMTSAGENFQRKL